MSIFAGTSEIKSIKAGAADVKAVYAGSEKVWPVEVEVPTIPTHVFADRVIHNWGNGGPDTPGGQYDTQFGPAMSGCNMRPHDFHLMIGACINGVSVYEGVWETGHDEDHQATATFYSFDDPQMKVFASIGVASKDITNSTHYIKMKANYTYYPYDFTAYSWVIHYEAMGSPDEGDLTWRRYNWSGGEMPILEGGIPNSIGIMCGAVVKVGSGANYHGVLGKQGGLSPSKTISVSGGYKYFRFDGDGKYEYDGQTPSGNIASRAFVYKKPTEGV